MIVAKSSGKYDVVVIGGGPGGYVAAIRAAQLGGKVALVEKDQLGGVCTNVGCMPTKTMLRAAEFLLNFKHAQEFGILVENFKVDKSKFIQHRDDVVNRLRQGIAFLLEKNGVQLVSGAGFVKSSQLVEVRNKSSNQVLETKTVVVATGSTDYRPPIPGVDGRDVLTGEEAATIREIPQRVVIAGGGAEGTEFATIFAALGSDVTLVEMMPNLLPLEDKDLGIRLQRVMSKIGVKVLVKTKVMKIDDNNGGKVVVASSDSGEIRLEGDMVLVGLGRKPNTANIGLEEVGVSIDRGRILVNDQMQTNVPNIYAIGDATGGAFAHEAMEGGVVAVENALGGKSTLDRMVIPRCIYTIPEVAAVGLTEEQARNQGDDISIGSFPFAASGRAITLGETEGLVKVIIDNRSKQLLGVHIIGHAASELISEATLAMSIGVTSSEIIGTIHAHPTLAEAFREAVLDAEQRSIHRVRVTA